MGYWAIAYIPDERDYINGGRVPPGVNNGLPWAPVYPSGGPIYGGGHPSAGLPMGPGHAGQPLPWHGHAGQGLPWAPAHIGGQLPWAPAHVGGQLPWGPGHVGNELPYPPVYPSNGLPAYPCDGGGEGGERPVPPAIWPTPPQAGQPIVIPPGTPIIPTNPIDLPNPGHPDNPIRIPPGTVLVPTQPIYIAATPPNTASGAPAPTPAPKA